MSRQHRVSGIPTTARPSQTSPPQRPSQMVQSGEDVATWDDDIAAHACLRRAGTITTNRRPPVLNN